MRGTTIIKVGIYLISLFFGTLVTLNVVRDSDLILRYLKQQSVYEIILMMFGLICISLVIREISRVKKTNRLLHTRKLTNVNESCKGEELYQ